MAAKDSFEPSTPFEGYMKAKLEGIEIRLDSLPCGESFKRLGKVENEVSMIKGKATVWGAITGFVAGAFAKSYIKI
mgnify:CR=1 FL=1